MPKYALHYFPVRARAEIIRLILTLKGEDFEDKRITQEEWKGLKSNYTCGQLPVLFIDGKEYAESLAIARYLARKFEFYGANMEDAFTIDQIIGLAQDTFTECVKSFFEKDEEKKKQMQKTFKEEKVPQFIGSIEKVVSKNTTEGYSVGKKLTLGDLAIVDIVDTTVDDVSKYPRIKAIVANVRGNDNLKKYFANRQQTPI